jgi:hypothetical protein
MPFSGPELKSTRSFKYATATPSTTLRGQAATNQPMRPTGLIKGLFGQMTQ